MALPQLKLRVEPEEMAKLATRLTELGYEESAVAEILGLWDISQMNGHELPGYVWRCKQNGSDLAQLTLLFLLGEAMPAEVARKLLGSDNVNNLLRDNLQDGQTLNGRHFVRKTFAHRTTGRSYMSRLCGWRK